MFRILFSKYIWGVSVILEMAPSEFAVLTNPIHGIQ
jgi:hypothetical protein